MKRRNFLALLLGTLASVPFLQADGAVAWIKEPKQSILFVTGNLFFSEGDHVNVWHSIGRVENFVVNRIVEEPTR